jgi:hypothetical protein
VLERPPFGVLAECEKCTNPYLATGAGGLIQSMLYGFGGLHITDKGLVHKPTKLPAAWKNLTLTGIGATHETLVVRGEPKMNRPQLLLFPLSLFTLAALTGYQITGTRGHALPAGAKILFIGDSITEEIAPPQSPLPATAAEGSSESLNLIPYGAAKLRITSFPTINPDVSLR